MDVEDESDEESDDESIDEELGYISPLETVNPYMSFKNALTGESPTLELPALQLIISLVLSAFQMKNGAGYQVATTSLGIEQQTLLMEIMAIADKPAAA